MEKWLWFVNSAGGAGAPPLHPEAQSVRVSRNPAIKLKQNGIGIIVDQVRIIESQWQKAIADPEKQRSGMGSMRGRGGGGGRSSGCDARFSAAPPRLLFLRDSVTPS
jgi:hypothetical protein